MLKSLLASWLAALISVPLSLFLAASGQGLGALLAGGGMIGVSTPWDRQAWALVNQPVLNFASLPTAGGYWLGSWIVPLVIALLAIPLSLRLGTLVSQLFVVQLAWVSVVIGTLWQPALDPPLSHVSRWLEFRDLPTEFGWLTVLAAVAAAVPIALRLISVSRITHFHSSRGRRLGVVVLHLFPVPVAWALVTLSLRGAVGPQAWIATGVPALAALAVAWIGYPAPLTHPITAVRGRVFAHLLILGILTWGAFLATGRPLANNRAAAIQWAREGSYNNIRSWMEPIRAPWLEPANIDPGVPDSTGGAHRR